METLRFFSTRGARTFLDLFFDCDSDARVRSALAALKLELSLFFDFFVYVSYMCHSSQTRPEKTPEPRHVIYHWKVREIQFRMSHRLAYSAQGQSRDSHNKTSLVYFTLFYPILQPYDRVRGPPTHSKNAYAPPTQRLRTAYALFHCNIGPTIGLGVDLYTSPQGSTSIKMVRSPKPYAYAP